MTEGIWMAIIGLGGTLIAGFFAFKSLKATLKNNLDLAVLQLQNEQKKTHELVNSRMTELLELTRKSSEAIGEKKGAENNQAATDAKSQDKK